MMRLTAAVSVVGMAACGAGDNAMSDDLKKDLELASSSDAISLASAPAQQAQVVSAVERTIPPAPRRIAPSQRVAKHRPAPRTPAPVEVEAADVAVEEVEEQPVAPAPAPVETETLPSPRPQPVLVSDGGDYGRGRAGTVEGQVLGGIIGVVLRGGVVVGDDECDPRTDRRRRGGRTIAVNHRFPPVMNPTFPGRVRF